MADLSKIKVKKDGVDTVYNLKDAAARQNIENARTESAQTYVKSLSASGQTITVTKGDDSTSTITTQDTTYTAATQEADGLMAANDKEKLDNIEEGAQVNAVTGVKGSAETNMRTGAVIISPSDLGLGNVENKSSEDIRDELTSENVTEALGFTPPRENTTYGVFGGATSSAAGTSGLVPQPAAGKHGSYLRGDSTWGDVVTGVKGNAESSFRSGNVNLTPANLGAATQADLDALSNKLAYTTVSNWDTFKPGTTREIVHGYSTGGSATGVPISGDNITYYGWVEGVTTYCTQHIYTQYTASTKNRNRQWIRSCLNGTWTSWQELATIRSTTVTVTYSSPYSEITPIEANIPSSVGTPIGAVITGGMMSGGIIGVMVDAYSRKVCVLAYENNGAATGPVEVTIYWI